MSDTSRAAKVTYLIQGEQGGPIKIGLSNTTGLNSRIASLQTGYPYRLKLVRLIQGNLEAELHSQFAHLRMNGEWFEPGEELLTFAGSDARKGDHDDFRAGFAAGFAAAVTEMEVANRRLIDHLDDPRLLSRVVEEAQRARVRDA